MVSGEGVKGACRNPAVAELLFCIILEAANVSACTSTPDLASNRDTGLLAVMCCQTADCLFMEGLCIERQTASSLHYSFSHCLVSNDSEQCGNAGIALYGAGSRGVEMTIEELSLGRGGSPARGTYFCRLLTNKRDAIQPCIQDHGDRPTQVIPVGRIVSSPMSNISTTARKSRPAKTPRSPSSNPNQTTYMHSAGQQEG